MTDSDDRRRQRYSEWQAIQRRDPFGCIAWPWVSVPPSYLDDTDRQRIDLDGGSELEVDVRLGETKYGLATCMVPGGTVRIENDLAYDGSHTTRKTFPQVTALRPLQIAENVSAGHSVAPADPYQRAVPVPKSLTKTPGQPGRWVVVAHACEGKPRCDCADGV